MFAGRLVVGIGPLYGSKRLHLLFINSPDPAHRSNSIEPAQIETHAKPSDKRIGCLINNENNKSPKASLADYARFCLGVFKAGYEG